MSDISNEDITHLAKLSRLTLSAEEKEKFAKQLPEILEFVDQLSAVAKLSSAHPSQTIPLAKLRADEESSEKLTLETLQKLAPAWHEDQVEVPAVFGEVADE
ncbi:MAG: Asp-tRNA(Asn)/Glu-tRNA(Gln) amidotransferase subunit GatC [Candidatus Berkelbacteria bacterium]|nr:Asp-tRNA(Asn)/Glu-tRNA(Gln) amidotransferase subunit GatC [Candidatus Berkelbacteria bacterium]MCR4307743.1 Asp-tRNA(Asn)/Glu-tRNA(Gln) amidotransferase subunit GatC [Candidatus Berkelbacteria bacterium]